MLCQFPGTDAGPCLHSEENHGTDQEVDLDGRPTGPQYLVCFECLEEERPHWSHDFDGGAETVDFGHDAEIGALFEAYDRLVRWEEHSGRLDATDPVHERAAARGRIVAFIASWALPDPRDDSPMTPHKALAIAWMKRALVAEEWWTALSGHTKDANEDGDFNCATCGGPIEFFTEDGGIWGHYGPNAFHLNGEHKAMPVHSLDSAGGGVQEPGESETAALDSRPSPTQEEN